MTLPEVMVSVGITSVVGYLAFNLITDFTRRAWEHEARSRALDERELAAKLIKNELPRFIPSVTGPLGEDNPSNVNLWGCNPSACVMKIKHKYSDINGVEATTDLEPLRADCVDVSDARLAQEGVDLNTKAVAKAVQTIGTTKCLSCPAGKAPRVSVTMYRFDPTSGAPSVVSTKMFPQAVGKNSNQGALAMGICVDWPAYQYDLGIDRYDRWEITLIPIFAGRAQFGGMKAPQISESLFSLDSKILISPSRRMPSDFKYTPLK